MLEKGLGIARDYAQALQWYRRAAEQGDALAQSSLGGMLTLGTGVRKDYPQAYFWLLLASTGDDSAKMMRDFVEKSLSSAEISQAQARASAWRPTLENQP
ncbi:tetratricopeptide repeat protein [Kerstersia gyiorum]|nr:hypothetical protein [Kerstersia gyiorum]MCP1678431.1 TPR repeat protein [Kerstersia gyiorum]MCP1823114.1 TPR repeat protein [Kerstersia gyiorum]MCP1826284.1 TPR repeat protein [Kerstersia gyiorum]MCW2450340.1 TPR repeat protein [Kerstersia gyiorum]